MTLMWIAIGGTAIVVLIIVMTMATIWITTTEDRDQLHGGEDGEDEEGQG